MNEAVTTTPTAPTTPINMELIHLVGNTYERKDTPPSSPLELASLLFGSATFLANAEENVTPHDVAARLSCAANHVIDEIASPNGITALEFTSVTSPDFMKHYELEEIDIEYLKAYRATIAEAELAIEPQYGTFRDETFRRIVTTQFLDKNIPGTIGVKDIIGLKINNTNFGNAIGDEIIRRSIVATYMEISGALKRLGLDDNHHPLILGRRGDEIRYFVPNIDNTTLQNAIREFQNQHQDVMDKINTFRTNGIPHSVQVYSTSADVTDKEHFDAQITYLDDQIERHKNTAQSEASLAAAEDALESARICGGIILEKRVPLATMEQLLRSAFELKREGVSEDQIIEIITDSKNVEDARQALAEALSQH